MIGWNDIPPKEDLFYCIDQFIKESSNDSNSKEYTHCMGAREKRVRGDITMYEMHRNQAYRYETSPVKSRSG